MINTSEVDEVIKLNYSYDGLYGIKDNECEDGGRNGDIKRLEYGNRYENKNNSKDESEERDITKENKNEEEGSKNKIVQYQRQKEVDKEKEKQDTNRSCIEGYEKGNRITLTLPLTMNFSKNIK